jgi:hypothetical protein
MLIYIPYFFFHNLLIIQSQKSFNHFVFFPYIIHNLFNFLNQSHSFYSKAIELCMKIGLSIYYRI